MDLAEIWFSDLQSAVQCMVPKLKEDVGVGAAVSGGMS
jgi:hypothetical protein